MMTKNQIRTAFINYLSDQVNKAIAVNELFDLCQCILTETCDFMSQSLIEIIPGDDGDQIWRAVNNFVWPHGDDSCDYTPEYKALERYTIGHARIIAKLYGYKIEY